MANYSDLSNLIAFDNKIIIITLPCYLASPRSDDRLCVMRTPRNWLCSGYMPREHERQ